MNALIIDSSQSYRQLLSKLCDSCGIASTAVATIDEAKQALQHQHFDLLCLAMKLAGGNSLEFCGEIRDQESYKHTPIFMLTSSSDADTDQLIKNAGVTELFKKQDFAKFQSYLENFVERESDDVSCSGRILYIEDSKSTALLISSVLEEADYRVDHFLSAELGIEAFNSNYYDLVLTDVVLEKLSGLEVVHAVRKSDSDKKNTIPIIAISSFDDNARKLELFSAGVNDYVSKPVMNEELLARIGSLIKSQKLLDSLNKKQEQLERLALTDQLTSLYNRHYLMDIAPKRIKQALRHDYPLCLMVVDIDLFKKVNDNHGHSVGDKVLQAVAKQLASGLRWEDIVARFGGEEFVILLDHCEPDDAMRIANHLRTSIEALQPAGLSITASFGVSALANDDPDFAKLFSRADKAVYEAKDAGRNCVIFQS